MLLAVYHIYFFFLVDSQHKIQFIEVVHQQQLIHSIGDTSMKVQVHRQQSPKKKKKENLLEHSREGAGGREACARWLGELERSSTWGEGPQSFTGSGRGLRLESSIEQSSW